VPLSLQVTKLRFCFVLDHTDVVKELIEGMVETYPHLTYLDGFPEVMSITWKLFPNGCTFSYLHLVTGLPSDLFDTLKPNRLLGSEKTWKSTGT
jgi:hypothetical protein